MNVGTWPIADLKPEQHVLSVTALLLQLASRASSAPKQRHVVH